MEPWVGRDPQERVLPPPSFSGGETEPQGGPAAGPGLGAGWRPVMNILAERPLASCRLTLPLGTGPRVAIAGRTDWEIARDPVWPDGEPHRGVFLLLSLVPLGPDPEVPRAVLGGDGWKAGSLSAHPAREHPRPACCFSV